MSNLFKASYYNIENDDTRVIDSNELFAKMMEQSRDKDHERRVAAVAQPFVPNNFDEEGESLNDEQLSLLTGDGEAAPEESSAVMTGGPAQGLSPEDIADLQAQAEEILSGARSQAQQMLNDAQGQIDQLRSQAMEEGRRAGYEEGMAKAGKESKDLEAQVQAREKELEAEYRKLTDKLEPEMVDTLTRIYEHVFSVNLHDEKNIILHLLSQALSHIESGNDYIIHVSPDDYDMIMDEKDELRENITSPNATMEIIEDSTMHENECIIETDGGVFDCSVGAELEELSRKLKLLSFERRPSN